VSKSGERGQFQRPRRDRHGEYEHTGRISVGGRPRLDLYKGVPTPIHGCDTLRASDERSDRSDPAGDVFSISPGSSSGNHILRQLPPAERERLLAACQQVRFQAGSIVARAGDAITSAYFPDSGVICAMNEMTTGHQLAMVAVGREGVIGLGPLFSVSHYPQRLVAVVDSAGCRVPGPLLIEMFQRSGVIRQITLAHVGRMIAELTVTAACHRVHSHRQRLARWLLITTEKAEQRWLQVTHETMAHMVGGPRHAVTMALNDLRAKGAIAHLRGRIAIVKPSVLVKQACECYVPPGTSPA